MEVYRITLEKYAHELISPGTESRWNSKGYFVIYSAGSKSLACLENLVHRDSEGLKSLFKVIVLLIPDKIKINNIASADLPDGWTTSQSLFITRKLGNNWLRSQESCVLKVPSAIINDEFNYLINPSHADFNKIKINHLEEFTFDSRLKL